MGRVLAIVVLALALAGAVWFLFLADPEPDSPSDLDELGTGEGFEEGAAAAAPKLQTSGKKLASTPSGPLRFSITGRVVDADGAAVVGIGVVARHTGKAWNRNDPSSYRVSPEESIRGVLARLEQPADALEPIVAEGRTDATGSFELKFAEAGKYRLNARPEAPRFSTAKTISVHEDKLTDSTTLQVLLGSPLNGRVLDDADAPVAATVSASWYSTTGSRSDTWRSAPVSASGDGRFALAAVPNGQIRFTLLLPSGRRLSGVSAETPHEGELVIRVPTGGGIVNGKVTDAEGNGVPSATLVLSMHRTKQPGVETTGTTSVKAVTGLDGTYSVDDAPLGRVTAVQALAEGFLPHTVPTTTLAAADHTVTAEKPLTLDVTLSRGGSVHGRVLDQDGGKAIVGAEVRLHAVSGSFMGQSAVARTAVTDAGGRYHFDAVAKGRHILLPQAEGYYLPQLKPANTGGGYGGINFVAPGGMAGGAPAALTVLVLRDGHDAERDLELARGHRVKGRVLDAAGQGVAGADIFARGYNLQQVGWQWGLGGLPKKALATSAAGGAFTVEGLPPKADWVLFATKKGYAGVYGAPIAVGPDAAAADITLQLAPGATVRGKVLDDAGKGVADVQVNYWGQNQETSGNRTSATTDAQGAFELLGMPAGDWTLIVQVQGRGGKQHAVKALTAGEVREGIELRLAVGVEVTGIVVDKDGEPVSGVALLLRSMGGMSGWNNTTTDSAGRFSFQGAAEGRSQIYTWTGGQQKPLGKPFDAPTTELRLMHERVTTAVIRGVVQGPDGASIPLSTVTVGATRSGGAGPMQVPGGGGTDAVGGAFERTVRGKGPWEVRVMAPRDEQGNPLNLQPARVTVEDAAERVVVKLEPGREIAGSVVDESGKGLADVMVRAASASARTLAQGRFRIRGLKDGPLTLYAMPPAGYVRPAPVATQAGAQDVRIVLTRGLEIGGTAFGPDGKPVKQAFVSAQWPAAGGAQPGQANVQVQPGGKFLLQGIPPGVSARVQVQVWSAGGGTALAPKVIENVRPGTKDLEVHLGGGLTIEGIVVGPDGKPKGGCFVYGTSVEGSKQTGYVQVGDDGVWKLSGLEPGRYKVSTMRMGGGATPTPVEVDAPARGVRLKLPKSTPLAGRVEGIPEGSGRWILSVVDGKGTRLSSAIVDTEGGWRVDGVRDGGGVYLHCSSTTSDHYAQGGPIQPGREDVVLRVKKGGTLSGVVDGVPENARAMVWVEGERGFRKSGSVTEDGTFTLRGLPPGSYTVKARTYDSSLAGETGGVSDGAKNVRVVLSAR